MRNSMVLASALIVSSAPVVAQGRQPNAAMMKNPDAAALFVDTQDESGLRNAFSARNVTIVDNFPPYVFTGPSAISAWVKGAKAHLNGITELKHHWGTAQEFSQTGDHAYFSMPVTWTELYFGKPVTEKGAWVFTLVRENDEWKIQTSVWGRTDTTPHH